MNIGTMKRSSVESECSYLDFMVYQPLEVI